MLNQSGATMWLKLSDGATLNELATRLMDVFGISRERALEDAGAFVASCLERNLIRASDSTA